MTRIGLLADSHWQDETTRRAVGLLVAAGADLLIHLGDLGSTGVLEALVAARDGRGAKCSRSQVFASLSGGFARILRCGRSAITPLIAVAPAPRLRANPLAQSLAETSRRQ